MPSQSVTLRELLSSGLTLAWQEAVAIAQGVAAASRSCVPRVVAESAIFDDFALGDDGTVKATSVDCAAVSVADLAMLLGRLLPAERAALALRAPAAVHFAVARALGLVQSVPFPSLEHFSAALGRYEQGEREPILRDVFRRHQSMRHARRAAAESQPAPAERRSAGARSDALRRLLREADRQAWVAVDRHAHPAGWTPRRHGPDVEMLRRFLREADQRNYELMQAARMTLRSDPPAAPATPEPAPIRPRRPAAWAARASSVRFAAFGSRARVAAGAAILLVSIGGVAARQPLGHALSSLVTSFNLSAPARPAAGGGRQVLAARASGAALPPAALPARTGQRPPSHRMAIGFAGTAAGDVAASDEPIGTAGESGSPFEPLHAFPVTSGRMIETLDVAHRPVFAPSFEANRAAIFDDGSQAAGSKGSRFVHVLSIANDRGRNYHPHLSPDGSTIAFDSDRDGSRGIYLASRDGRHVRRVTPLDQYAAFPAWSPDGSRLAFVQSEPLEPTVWNVWSTDLRSGATRRLTSYRDGQPWGVSWFPDGNRICFAHENELVVLDTSTGTSRSFASPRADKLVRLPAVSPDGARVIFQLDNDGAWLLEMADGSMRQVLADPSVEDFVWSRDGAHILFRTRGGQEWTSWSLQPEAVQRSGQ